MSRTRLAPLLRVRRRQHWRNSVSIYNKSKLPAVLRARDLLQRRVDDVCGLFSEQVLNTLSAENIVSLATNRDLAKRLSRFALLTRLEQSTFLWSAQLIYDSNGKSESGSGIV